MVRTGKPAFAYDHLGDVAQDKMYQATLPVRSYHQQVRTEFRNGRVMHPATSLYRVELGFGVRGAEEELAEAALSGPFTVIRKTPFELTVPLSTPKPAVVTGGNDASKKDTGRVNPKPPESVSGPIALIGSQSAPTTFSLTISGAANLVAAVVI